MHLTFPTQVARAIRAGLAMLAITALFPSVAHAEEPATIIARVGTVEVTTADVDRTLARLPQAPETIPEEQWNATKNLLLSMLVVEDQILNSGDPMPADLHAALMDTRRQVMLDYYIAHATHPYTPSDADIDSFILSNPNLFGDRAVFRYVEMLIFPTAPSGAEEIESIIGKSLISDEIRQQDIQNLANKLRAANLQFGVQSMLRSSEQLSAELLTKLETLATSETHYTLEPAAQGFRLTLLLQRIADPVDATQMRAQIAEGLIKRDADQQRKAIIEQLAQKALNNVDDTPVASAEHTVPARKRPVSLEQALLAVDAALLVLLTFGGFVRVRSIPEAQLRAYRDGYRPGLFTSPVFVTVSAILFVVVGSFMAAMTALPLLNAQGLRQGGVALLAGGMPAALVGGLLFFRARAKPQQWLGPMTLLALLAGLAALMAFVLAD